MLKDPDLNYMKNVNGYSSLKRAGMIGLNGPGWRRAGRSNAQDQYDHAWPLLSHTDLGHQDHVADTHWVQLGNYMPKRNKGTAPWFRGADTYSPLYCEQGRYEYQRYLMISRFPSEYKKHFQWHLHNIRCSGNENMGSLPQEALHQLLHMIVDNFNPQHVHYLAAMQTLMDYKEYDMARDVWKVMERQQTWPDDKLISKYLELCATDKAERVGV